MGAFEDPAVVVAVVGAVFGPAVMLVLGWARDRRKSTAAAAREVAEARKADATADASVASVVLQWADRLAAELATVKAKVDGLEAQVEALQRENRRLRAHNAQLSAQVVDLGGVPHAMPED